MSQLKSNIWYRTTHFVELIHFWTDPFNGWSFRVPITIVIVISHYPFCGGVCAVFPNADDDTCKWRCGDPQFRDHFVVSSLIWSMPFCIILLRRGVEIKIAGFDGLSRKWMGVLILGSGRFNNQRFAWKIRIKQGKMMCDSLLLLLQMNVLLW